jgi:hypothetical protein
MNNLIACQPSAIKAVRLQCLVPPHPEKIVIRDLLGKDEVKIQNHTSDVQVLQQQCGQGNNYSCVHYSSVSSLSVLVLMSY